MRRIYGYYVSLPRSLAGCIHSFKHRKHGIIPFYACIFNTLLSILYFSGDWRNLFGYFLTNKTPSRIRGYPFHWKYSPFSYSSCSLEKGTSFPYGTPRCIHHCVLTLICHSSLWNCLVWNQSLFCLLCTHYCCFSSTFNK